MGIETLASATALGAGAGGYVGYQQKKQAEREADITMLNTEQQAQLVEKETEQLKQTQKSRYLASGVDLSGSPLLMLEDTLARGGQQAEAVRETGYRTAKAMKRKGRDAFISSILSGTTGGLKIGYNMMGK